MKIKIDADHLPALAVAIDAAEGGARPRRVSAADLVALAEWAEKGISWLPEAHRQGCEVAHSPEQMAYNYRYPAEGTYATLQRGSRHWYLVHAWRSRTGHKAYGRGSLDLIRVHQSPGTIAAAAAALGVTWITPTPEESGQAQAAG